MKITQLIILSLVALGVVGALLTRQRGEARAPAPVVDRAAPAEAPAEAPGPSDRQEAAATLPRLVELGSHGCASCQAMFPVLDDLRARFPGHLQVDFIDVWADPEEARPYGIRIIPSQVLFDARGQEIFRHEGFISADELVATFARHGVDLP